MAYPTLFLRREPARDGTPRKYDVVAFDEVNGKPDLSHEKARWSWSASSKPHRGRKYVMLNCYRWNIKWLDHMGKPE